MIELLGILFDFGLLVLIWMVQLIVYPSFLFYQPKDLLLWHRRYTGLIAIIVIPLMFGQLTFSIVEVYSMFSWVVILKLFLITFNWVFTFAYFAPLHTKLSSGFHSKSALEQLVSMNWYRTIAWTSIFLFSFINYYVF